MPETLFSIRLATIADIDGLTELHIASFEPEDHIPVRLGKNYVRATYQWLVTSGMSYVLVADTGHQIVGLIAVSDRAFTAPMFKACVKEFVLAILRNPLLLGYRDLWRRLFRRPDATSQGRHIADYPGMAQMTIGAVDENYRGYGVFPALVEATCTYSEERGSRAIRAGIYRENMPSRRVFIKLGWIETPILETRDTVFYVMFLDPTLSEEIGIEAN